jgi:ribosome-binding factor A
MGRKEKVEHQLRREISLILHDELKDPRLGFITITGVEMAADLRHAKIFYSILGREEDYAKTKIALESAQGYIRHLIATRMMLRFTPELMFREDRSTEYGIHIQKVIDEIHEREEHESTQKRNSTESVREPTRRPAARRRLRAKKR